MQLSLSSDPAEFARHLVATGRRRAWVMRDASTGRLTTSDSSLSGVADFLEHRCADYAGHEAVLFGVGRETEALFAVFVHRTRRGQAQGGVRRWSYDSTESLVRDGLRLSQGMGRKCALAGLWWGGGKAVIAESCGSGTAGASVDPDVRAQVYREFGEFVTSLRGSYVTAEDVGTAPADMAQVYAATRFVTCVPESVGGSGNPSAMTADGVISAMRAALGALDMGGLEGKRIAMQGAGNVGTPMIDRLLDFGVERIDATELSADRRVALLDHYSDPRLHIRLVEASDNEILAQPCDVLAPNALGGILNSKTIPEIHAPIVCGSANNQLEDESRDAAHLSQRGITLVPDYVANRMGIVACSNEHVGTLPEDPQILKHLDPDCPESIPAVVVRTIEEARRQGSTPTQEANRMADELGEVLHPIWGHRAWETLRFLSKNGWDRS